MDMTKPSNTIRMIIAVVVLLAGVGIGVGAVAADDATVTEESEEPVDLTDLLQEEVNSSITLVEDILDNGVTI